MENAIEGKWVEEEINSGTTDVILTKNEYYSYAPKENQTPIFILLDANAKVKLFSQIFGKFKKVIDPIKNTLH